MKASGVKVPLETYLKRATHGLPRRSRAEAQAELRSHVHERAHELRQSGSSPEAAELRAVQELGEARTVARSLQRSHHVHPLLSTLVLSILVVAVAWLAGTGAANLRGEQLDRLGNRVGLLVGGIDQRWPGLLDWDEYQRTMSNLGVQISGRGLKAQLRLAGQPSVPVAESTRPSQILMYERLSNWRLGADLYDLNATMDALVQAGWPVKVDLSGQSSLKQPTLGLNGQRLGSDHWWNGGTEMIVLNAAGRALDTLELPHNVRAPEGEAPGYRKQKNIPFHPDALRPAYTLPATGSRGHLYVLAVRDADVNYSQIDPTSARQAAQREPIIRLLIAPAGPGGNLNFVLWKLVKETPRLRLYPNAQAWGEAPVSLTPSSAERPAMLIEVQPELSALAHGLTVVPLGGQLKPQIRP